VEGEIGTLKGVGILTGFACFVSSLFRLKVASRGAVFHLQDHDAERNGGTMPRQTTFMKPGETTRQWHHIDADGQILGRLAAKIAPILMGKHRPEYTPHVDTGDYVVVTNAAKIALTGRKGEQRMHMRYSGYPGGLHMRSTNELLEKHPERVVEQAIKRMLPKTRLGRAMFKKLKVYSGPDHKHGSQAMHDLSI
tara:strand:+ start:39132 stop:39713 length:582 start_codon:yes stop_codon:yes gene_type:complete